MDGAPVREKRGRTIRFRNKSEKGTVPRSRRGGARKNGVVQRKKGRSQVVV